MNLYTREFSVKFEHSITLRRFFLKKPMRAPPLFLEYIIASQKDKFNMRVKVLNNFIAFSSIICEKKLKFTVKTAFFSMFVKFYFTIQQRKAY